MRIYLNPCFSRYSFDKPKHESQTHLNNHKMENHYLNRSESSSGGTNNNNNINEKSVLKQETFNIDDNLELEFRQRNNRNKNRRKFVIFTAILTLILLIIIGIIAYMFLIYIPNTTKNKDCNNCGSKENLKGNTLEASKTVDNNSKTCTTTVCKIIVDNFKESMNLSVDPCVNFHEYACGVWPKYHPLPPSMPKFDTMALLSLKKMSYLKKIIEKEIQETHKREEFKNKMFTFYDSCMDLDSMDARGSRPLLDFISKFGRWSPIKTWTEVGDNNHDITSLLIKSHQYFFPSVYDDFNKSPLFKTLVKVNDLNSKKHIFEINIPDLPISDLKILTTSSPRANSVRAKYQLLQTNYVALLGPADDAKDRLQDLINFEIKLAKITNSAQYLRNAMSRYNVTTVDGLQNYLGNTINWLEFIKQSFAPLGIKITRDTNIGVRLITVIKKINNLMASTPEQVVKDYIIWVCIWKFGSYTSARYREADYNFKSSLLGIQERPKQWKKCVTDLEQTMEFALASSYVEQALDKDDKAMVTQMVTNITREFSRNLVNVEWMDVSTKAAAFDKVKSIKHNIGYPEVIKNATYLNQLYRRVKVTPKKYFENALNMYKEKRILNMILLNAAVDREAYDLPPTLAEAYFDPNKNKMVLLAGIIHIPFYDLHGPMALNYGALGLVIGHELTHAFDNIGRQFDGNGEHKNWWTATSSKAFENRSSCIVDQYSNYTIYGLHVDGKYTLGENLADNGGIKVAYMAYKEWERLHGKEKPIEGVPLTMDQLFFVSMGQVWCGAYREEYAKNSLSVGYHSPAKFRTIGPLSNLKEFSDTFNCPVGSPMNPVKKCRVW